MKRMLAVFMLVAMPAMGQEHSGAASAPSGGKGDGASRAGNSGGRSAPTGGTASSGGSVSSTGSSSGANTSGAGSTRAGAGGSVSTGGRHAATGGSGVAVSRGGERGSYAGNGGRHGDAVVNSAPAAAAAPGTASGGAGSQAVGRDGGRQNAHLPAGGSDSGPSHGRQRKGDEPIVGTAVPRGSVPAPPINGGAIGIGGYFPWWIGSGFYGGYYGGYGYYDPWFGAYPDDYSYAPSQGYSTSFTDEGSLRLKIKPREAEVYVDGYYVGIVDDFDGVFQRLHIDSGPHHIEVRASGYEPLSFDVRITPDRTTTYQGEMKKISD